MTAGRIVISSYRVDCSLNDYLASERFLFKTYPHGLFYLFVQKRGVAGVDLDER
jgi:hypothetical protein